LENKQKFVIFHRISLPLYDSEVMVTCSSYSVIKVLDNFRVSYDEIADAVDEINAVFSIEVLKALTNFNSFHFCPLSDDRIVRSNFDPRDFHDLLLHQNGKLRVAFNLVGSRRLSFVGFANDCANYFCDLSLLQHSLQSKSSCHSFGKVLKLLPSPFCLAESTIHYHSPESKSPHF
jgi:hypothetical protein